MVYISHKKNLLVAILKLLMQSCTFMYAVSVWEIFLSHDVQPMQSLEIASV